MNGRRLVPVLAMLIFIVIFTMGSQGPCDPVPPPFDATGEYEGQWWSGQGEHCPVSGIITMDPSPAFPPVWGPAATFHVDFSCIELPPEFPPITPVDFPTVGVLDEQGNMIFTALGCGPGFCINWDSAGVGVDLDDDGIMDEYSGEWIFAILIAGLQPFGVGGEFSINAVETE